MGILVIAAVCGVLFLLAYRVYGSLLARLLQLREDAVTPAVELRDGVDYEPIEPKFLLSQHFSAIAAAGPVVGPILAGVAFGWLPALLWIVIGSIFVGGVHDITSLVASIRHKARSIAEVVREHMTKRSYLLFLVFIWLALVYIIVAFTDVVAMSFVGRQTLEDGSVVSGGGIASSSLMYLVLPIVMGLLLRFTKLGVNLATLIFLPLVGVAIWAGQHVPIDMLAILHGLGFDSATDAVAVKVWDVLLLAYCLVAGALPLWLLLQPRGHLGGYFLYVALAGCCVGILIGGLRTLFGDDTGVTTVSYPAFIGWTGVKGEPLLPILFITIACGACSGFHCLIASGTTSKQLRKETDAKLIGYGAMVLEGMVAVISLACVMMLATGSPLLGSGPNAIYANGLSRFFGQLGVPVALGYSFGLLAFTTFVYDTLDVCTRLGRYIVQELTGMRGAVGRWVGTSITALVPLVLVMLPGPIDAVTGKAKPAWQVFWPLFGASNQLLAALALLGVTVWLWRTRRVAWVWYVTGLPAVVMYVMSLWALCLFIRQDFWNKEWAYTGPSGSPVPWAAMLLVGLAVMMLLEAIAIFVRRRPPTAPEPELAVPAAA